MPAPVLDIEVTRRLAGFTLEVKLVCHTRSVSLFGPSGAGKSLLLSLIGGLSKPDQGRIAVGGRLLFDSRRGIDLAPQKRRVGMVFQDYALFPHLTVEQNLLFGLPGAKRGDERVSEMARALGIAHRLQARPDQLSGGERQRVALGRSLLPRPSVLLLDEPFSALDRPKRESLRMDLLDFLCTQDIPTVVVTHDLEEAYLMGQELAVMEGGRIFQVGPRDEVMFRPMNSLVANLMAVRNFVPGRVVERTSDCIRVEVGSLQLEVRNPEEGLEQDQVILGFRPENVRILWPDRKADKVNTLEGVITSDFFTGLQHHLFIQVQGGPRDEGQLHVRASIPDYPYQRMGLHPGGAVSFHLPPSCIQVIPGGRTQQVE